MSIPATTQTADLPQDVDKALMVLEKGLRSKLIGERCEAIHQFPQFFEQFPFSTTITSAFLKLADYFMNGNNILRLQILQVTERSEKQLDKISSLDEVVRRIFSVIHSNDPIARTLTLRILASFSRLVSDRKDIHHIILDSLKSSSDCEVYAGIFAARRYAQNSAIFASSVVPVVFSVVDNIETSPLIKESLLQVLDHTFPTASTAQASRDVVHQLLAKMPSVAISRHLLSLLTKIVLRTHMDASELLDLLLHSLQVDTRLDFISHCWVCLEQLAHYIPHLWLPQHVNALWALFDLSVEGGQQSVLRILRFLGNSVLLDSPLPLLLDRLDNCLVTHGTEVTSELLAALIYYPALLESNIDVILRISLTLLLQEDLSDQCCHRLLKTLSFMTRRDARRVPSIVDELCGCVALTTRSHPSRTLLIVKSLQIFAYQGFFQSLHFDRLLHVLMTLDVASQFDIFQRLCYLLMTVVPSNSWKDSGLQRFRGHMKTKLGLARPWELYQLARRALLLGCYAVADVSLLDLSQRLLSGKNREWLLALSHVAAAEATLQQAQSAHNYFESLSVSCRTLQDAMLLIECVPEFAFQLHYLALRLCVLRRIQELLLLLSETPSEDFELITDHLFRVTAMDEFQSKAFPLNHYYFGIDDVSASYLRWVEYSFQTLMLYLRSSLEDIELTDQPEHVPSFNNECATTLIRAFVRGLTQKRPENRISLGNAIAAVQEYVQIPFPLPSYFLRCTPPITVQLSVTSPSRGPISTEAGVDLSIRVDGIIALHTNLSNRRIASAHIETIVDGDTEGSQTMLAPVNNEYFTTTVLIKTATAPKPSLNVSLSCKLVDNTGKVWHVKHDPCRVEVQIRQEKKSKPVKQKAETLS